MHSQTNAKHGPAKIGPRLYEYVQRDGKKSYYADVIIDGRQTRIKLDASSRSDARKAQTDLGSKHNHNELVAPTKKTVREVGEEWLRTLDVHGGPFSLFTLDICVIWCSIQYVGLRLVRPGLNLLDGVRSDSVDLSI
jgi:hypothetical protein